MITAARPHLSKALDFRRTRVHAQPRSDSLCLIPLIFCPARGPEVPAASFTDCLNTVEQAYFGMSLTNLIGRQFGRLTVIARAPNGPGWKTKWHCRCDCGNQTIVYAVNLTYGRTISCGKHPTALTHGQHKSRTYKTWQEMRSRCQNPNKPEYKWYGGRGIKVCDRWAKFENFHADMGDRPEGTSLDRYPDHNGNYEPGNCRWATQKEQMRNIRRNRLITFAGETLCMAAWAERLGIADSQMWRRICKWPIERALTEPRNERFNTRGAR